MNHLKRLLAAIQANPLLTTLLVGTFLLRIAGVLYGLPLTVVADEPPFVLGALQMLQTHTLIPALHMDAFTSILYYPPYLCYLYLIPFAGVVAGEYLLWHGQSSLFIPHLAANLTPFFVAARVIITLLSILSIYCIYRIAQSIFTSRGAALLSAFLAATSLTYMSLSMVSRHWLPITFLFVLVLYLLTREHVAKNHRLFYALICAGIGMGVSTFSVVTLVPITLWFFLFSDMRISQALRDTWIRAGIICFAILAPLPSLLYPHSQGFLSGVFGLHGQTSLVGVLTSPFAVLLKYAYAEPVLIMLALIGAGVLYTTHRRWFVFFSVFFVFYALLFYLVAAFEFRFLLPLVPVYALLGGACWDLCKKYKAGVVLLCALLLIPLVASVRLSQLAYIGDTRSQALAWELENLSTEDKVLVVGELMRFPVTPEAVDELKKIDPRAVRKSDMVETALARTNIPHNLNLYAVQNEDFFKHIVSYARSNNYTYLIYDPRSVQNTVRERAFNDLVAQGKMIARWEGFYSDFSIADSSFGAPLLGLFEYKLLGPTIVVYKLNLEH